MQTQTVQNSPLLPGNQGAGRPANSPQEDSQFAQALNKQIERQGVDLQPAPQPNAGARRADAPKPVTAQAQPARHSAPAPKAPPAQAPAQQANAGKPAAGPAKASDSASQTEAAAAGDASGTDTAQTTAAGGADSSDAATADPATDSAAAQAADAQQVGNPAADMLALMASLAQLNPSTGAAGTAATTPGEGVAAAATSDSAAPDEWSGHAAAGLAELAARAAPPQDSAASAGDAAAPATADDSALPDAFAKLAGQDVAAATDQAGVSPAKEQLTQTGAQHHTDFQAALQRADAGKAAEAAAQDAERALQPPAGLQPSAIAQAPAAQAQAAQALSGNQLHARVGSQGWDQQLGQKVVWMVRGGEQSASLTLNPPDLGPLQVVLSVSNDQASVSFTAAQPEVREALEQALPKLRESMGEAGIKLGDTSVSSGNSEQQQAFADMAAANEARGRGAGGQNDNADAGDQSAESAPQLRRSGLGVVDTFA
jgi:flagellar hook-length control protein FliK